MRIRLLFILFFLLLLLPGICLAGAQRPDSAPSPGAKVGEKAPDFTLKDVQGNPVTLSDLRGKVVFLNFWATWCPPCRAEMPSMERLNEAFSAKDFVMLAVNVEEGPEIVKNFLEKNPHSFTVLLDNELKAQEAYGVYRFPETFIIDKQGKIVEHYLGARDWSSVEFMKQLSSLVSG